MNLNSINERFSIQEILSSKSKSNSNSRLLIKIHVHINFIITINDVA